MWSYCGSKNTLWNSELVILISAGCVVLGRCDVFSNPKPNIQTLKAMCILFF